MTSSLSADPGHVAEYESMRAAIRERGTARILLVPAASVAWCL